VKTPRVSDAQLKKAIGECDGNVTDIAAALKIDRSTVYRRIAKSEELQAAMTEAQDILTDVAVSHISRGVRNGEQWALAYYMNNSPGARRKGWGRNVTEVTGAEGGPIQAEITIRQIPAREDD
jgi:hypothetical protein